MRPITISMAPTALDRDGIGLAQQRVGAGALSIDGTLASGGVATLGAVSTVTLYSAGNLSAVTFTITGTDHYGLAISESRAGPNAGTVTSSKSYKTVTAVSTSATIGTNVEIGVDGTGTSRAVPMDIHQAAFSVALGLDITGTIDVTVQHTFEDPFAASWDPYAATWFNHSSLAAKTSDTDGNYSFPCRAIRLKVNSSTSGSASLTIIQSGINSGAP